MGWNGSGGGQTPSRKGYRRPSAKKVTAPVRDGGAIPAPHLKRPLVCAVAAVLVALAWWGLRTGGSEDGRASEDGRSSYIRDAKGHRRLKRNRMSGKSARESVRDAMPRDLEKSLRRGTRPRPRRRMAVDMLANLSGEDRRLAENVQAALDENDFGKAVEAANAALRSGNAEVRLDAVDALGWFGAEALPELTGAMADGNEDVREAAENHFEQALHDLEKPEDRFRIAMAAFGALSADDQLASLGGLVGNAATEFIDNEENEERRFENRVAVVQALVDVIEGEGGQKNAEAAAEAYQDITGNEWLGMDEAERYLRDPDNYDPDEPPPADSAQGQSGSETSEGTSETESSQKETGATEGESESEASAEDGSDEEAS